MKVSTKGRYALRMMIDIGLHDTGEFISLRDVATRQGISVKYMEQIVSQLTKTGFLLSVRGPRGGYRLAKEPAQYTAGDILRATEGSLAPISCVATTPSPCARASACAAFDFWEGLYRQVSEYVDSMTLADLMAREGV